jgi:hypothetical protein
VTFDNTALRLTSIPRRCWNAEEMAEGSVHLRADPNHKKVNPVLYRELA